MLVTTVKTTSLNTNARQEHFQLEERRNAKHVCLELINQVLLNGHVCRANIVQSDNIDTDAD